MNAPEGGSVKGQAARIKSVLRVEGGMASGYTILDGDTVIATNLWPTTAREIVRRYNAAPELLAACKAAFDEACRDNRNQKLIDQLDTAIGSAQS